ncbi:TonB family protein [Pedobacter sp. CG_S7]|uniref:TonB family protein n=1 Tax=Pedobacter sp. CG_S7 TaxID=3143930 RepID=UPI003399492B
MRKILLLFFLFATFSAVAQPAIKGGLETFIKVNLVYPAFSLRNCLEGNVTIAFQLNKDGEVYHSFIQSGIGTDLDDEALRLIRKSSGKWVIPADYDTTAVLIIPVNFKLESYNCVNKSKAEIQQAINAYQSSLGLTNAILNFYKNKEAGKYKKEEEQRFLQLKTELGYDKAYMEAKIKEGMKKLKEKDRQGACEDFLFVKHMGFDLADKLLQQYCP